MRSRVNGGVTEDGRSVTYKLKRGVLWADGSGEEDIVKCAGRDQLPHAPARVPSRVHAEVRSYFWRSADEDRPGNPRGVEGCPTRSRNVIHSHHPGKVRHVDPACSIR